MKFSVIRKVDPGSCAFSVDSVDWSTPVLWQGCGVCGLIAAAIQFGNKFLQSTSLAQIKRSVPMPISASTFHHNLHVGTHNRTGQKFIGHDDIWLYDELQLMIEKMRNLVPVSHRIKGWVNGLLYQPTSEVSGILPIPISIQVKAGLQPMIKETTSLYLHHYFACRQGTLFAVIGVHTIAEKKLFSQLMKEEPSFYWHKTRSQTTAGCKEVDTEVKNPE